MNPALLALITTTFRAHDMTPQEPIIEALASAVEEYVEQQVEDALESERDLHWKD